MPGGIADRIVRLRVYDMPRHVARELDHAAIRDCKAEALHFHLDLRRPEIHRTVGVGCAGPAADAARAGRATISAAGRSRPSSTARSSSASARS